MWWKLRYLLLALFSSASVAAHAQATAQPSDSAFDLERLELNPSGMGSLVVGSGELLPASTFRSAVLSHYAHEPLLLVDGGDSRGRVVRERLTLHLMRQYSLAQRVEFALTLPIVVFQTGDPLDALPNLATGGLASPILSARVGLLRSVDGAPIDLALQAATALPFGNPHAFARNPGLTLAPRLLASKRLFDRYMVSAEVGGLLRPPVTLGAYTIHNELSGNLAAATVTGPLRGELAVRGAYYFGKAPKSVEVLGGVRYALSERIELTAVAAVGALRAPGTPMFRVLFGASFLEGTKLTDLGRGPPPPPDRGPTLLQTAAKPDGTAKPDPEPKVVVIEKQADPGPCQVGKPHDPAVCPELDLDDDGLKNSADKCPTEAEDRDGFEDGDGCPEADNDADGLPDGEDKCPDQAGAADRQGCPIPDRDRDGVPDEQDRCPDRHGLPSHGGCPLVDSDGDGLLDSVDGCPEEKGPLEARGCPVKDTDGDGVADHVDNCRNEKGTKKNHGCPARERQRVYITREKLVIVDRVHFATGSARVLPKSFPLLKQVAKVIKEHPEIKKVVVEGHTDNVGGAMKNRLLSQQRADSVRRYLIMQGVEPDRLISKGFGFLRPIMPNLTARGRAANRRVEFVIPEVEAQSTED